MGALTLERHVAVAVYLSIVVWTHDIWNLQETDEIFEIFGTWFFCAFLLGSLEFHSMFTLMGPKKFEILGRIATSGMSF